MACPSGTSHTWPGTLRSQLEHTLRQAPLATCPSHPTGAVVIRRDTEIPPRFDLRCQQMGTIWFVCCPTTAVGRTAGTDTVRKCRRRLQYERPDHAVALSSN